MFILATKLQLLPLKTVLKVRDFRQPVKCDKTAYILVQNVPLPSKMLPRHAGSFSHVCRSGWEGADHYLMRTIHYVQNQNI